MNEAKTIIITATLVAQYRASHELNRRAWQDQNVRFHVIGLSRQLTIAEMAGWETTSNEIVALLLFCEPLHELDSQTYQAWLLQIAFFYYRMRDLSSTGMVVRSALALFPNDARLLRLETTLTAMCEEKPKRTRKRRESSS